MMLCKRKVCVCVCGCGCVCVCVCVCVCARFLSEALHVMRHVVGGRVRTSVLEGKP